MSGISVAAAHAASPQAVAISLGRIDADPPRSHRAAAHDACAASGRAPGIGVVLVCGNYRKEISEYIGEATSNIAELSAVVRALSAIKDRDRHLILHSDSEYTIGMLTKGWKIRANRLLIEQARELAAGFQRLRFEWVPGHAGVAENERCDVLARAAIQAARASTASGQPMHGAVRR